MSDQHQSTLDGGHRATSPHHHDDEPGGRTDMTRRTALGVAGAGGVALLFAGLKATGPGKVLEAIGPDVAEAASTSCVMTPAKTVGPYFVDEKLDRSDVRADSTTGAVQAGVPLTLTMYIFDADNDCAPVEGATVDIWHANAEGIYSDETANGTAGVDWLRGYQTTDASGKVCFTTIYPGWYTGRAVHIHFKVRVYDGSSETLEFTSQMFFTDALNTQVFTSASPYKDRSQVTPDTTDTTDDILGSDAATLTLHPTGDVANGFSADFSVGVSQSTSQLDNTSDNMGGGPGGPMGPGGPPVATSTSGGTTTTTNTTTGSSTTEATSSDKKVAATLRSAAMMRTALGTRQLKLTIKASEAVTATARLTRSGKRIASRKARLAKGTRTLKVTVPSATAAGAAKLKLTLVDAAGNKKSYSRNVHITRRSSRS